MSPIRKLYAKSRNLIIRPQESFGYVAFGLSLLLLTTKILGIIKSNVLIYVAGPNTNTLDLFFLANTIPEFIFTIVVIGGINASLIPVLSQVSHKETKQDLKNIFSSIINLFFVVLLVICFLFFIFAPEVINFSLRLNIGKTTKTFTSQEINQAIHVLRILIFSPVILCISSIFSSLLQIRKRFFITQFAAVFYNLGLIIVALAFAPLTSNTLSLLAFGVVTGSFLHFLIQLPAILKSKIEYKLFTLDLKNEYVRRSISQTLPRTLGLTADYIGSIFQTIVAISLAPYSLVALTLAQSIRELPTTMFGISISQAIFPRMTELGADKNLPEFQELFTKGIRTILFWTLPITALIFVLRTPITQLIFGLLTNNINLPTISLISYCILFLSPSIIFYSVLSLVNRAFYSFNDSKTPTFVSLFVIFIELFLVFALANLFSNFKSVTVNPLRILADFHNLFRNGGSSAAIGGVAFSSSIVSFINLSLLIFFLRRYNVYFFYESKYILKKVLSTVLMVTVGIILFKLTDNYINTTKIVGVIMITFNTTAAMCLTYYISERLLKDDDIKILDHPISRFRSAFKKTWRLISESRIKSVSTPT